MKRRKFLVSLIGTTAAAGWVGWQFGMRGQAAPHAPGAGKWAKVTRSSWALGTGVNITVYHADRKAAAVAIDHALAELDSVEQVLSLYRPDSQICRLNQTGSLSDPHPHLLRVLETASLLSAQTDGQFDVTIQPLFRLYADAAAAKRLPAEDELRAVLAKVDWRRVRVSGREVRLDGAGTQITLNGIAQGFASDIVTETLRSHGIAHALIDTGEIGTVGDHVAKDHWTIGIKHPRQPQNLLAFADLKGRSLATSGDYETVFSDGYTHHHLLNPRTGHSPSELSSVTVAAPSGLEADALSTALFLVGVDRGRQLIADWPGADALFVTKSGRMIPTAGFPMHS
jgi:thiamine biosynthesis lipoprotein